MSEVKILHVIARMNVGGTSRYLAELVEKIPSSAIAVVYVQAEEIEDSIISTLPIFRVPHLGRKISLASDFKAWLELRKLIRELEPEILHTHTFKAGLIGRLIRGRHKRVHTFHGHLLEDDSFSVLEMKVITWLEKFLAKRTDLLISVGERVGSELRAAGVGVGKNWCSIPPGVYKLPIQDKTVARSRLNLDLDSYLVGWIARMTAVKNPDLFLEVARMTPQIKFVMAGGGDLLEIIKSKAPSNVSVIGWCDASTFFSAVDSVISTSNNEGMPIALIEAQLAGLPVIATNVGSNSEVIQDKNTGLVVEKNPKALTEALLELTSEKKVILLSKNEIGKLASARFSPEIMIKSHQRNYEKLLGVKVLDS